MPSPVPKAATLRQRRNRTTTAAQLEAPPATPVDLPERYSTTRCTYAVDSKAGCPLTGATHQLAQFAKAQVEPHEFAPAVVAWHPMTVRWWTTIWDSPMAGEWVDADVPDLVALAALVDEFWRTGDPRVAAEVRLRNREFGLTPLARRMLQWEVARGEAAERSRAKPAPPGRRRDPRQLLAAVK